MKNMGLGTQHSKLYWQHIKKKKKRNRMQIAQFYTLSG